MRQRILNPYLRMRNVWEWEAEVVGTFGFVYQRILIAQIRQLVCTSFTSGETPESEDYPSKPVRLARILNLRLNSISHPHSRQGRVTAVFPPAGYELAIMEQLHDIDFSHKVTLTAIGPEKSQTGKQSPSTPTAT